MTTPNRAQADHWNDTDAIGHWIAEQAGHDRMLEPYVPILLDALDLRAGEAVLDVGCGCGATTRAAASRGASVVGVDISGPMLAQARRDADAAGLANTSYVQADAQTHGFAARHFDAVLSRFGVMFFDDPVAAFGNLRRAVKPGGRLAFVCWQSLAENPWLLVPGTALARHAPLPDTVTANAPGMFALADRERLLGVLADAGWRDARASAHDVPILVGGGGTVDDAIAFLRTTSLGRTMLADLASDAVERAVADVRTALAPFATADGVRLASGVWLAEARA